MSGRYVFDTGALIAVERRKIRALRFFRLAHTGLARIIVPLPVVAEWWRGRTDDRDDILAATTVVGSVAIAQAAGVALAELKRADASLTVDAMVMATAALFDAVVVTQDFRDLSRFGAHFPRVVVLSV